MSCPQMPSIIAGETRLCAIDLTEKLTAAELLTGTPTVTASPNTLTVSNAQVNSVAIEVLGRTVGIGKAVQFKVTGATAPNRYTLTAACGSTSNPAEAVREVCVLVCDQ